MHGRVKTRSTEEEKEAKRKEREKKVKLYRAGMDSLFSKRLNAEYAELTLDVSGKLLWANPDIYTLWNIRREVLLILKDKRVEDEFQEFMERELSLTEQCLKANPKSYGAWHHRVWVLNNMMSANWNRELVLCNKYLDLDERNFHCWDYRRIVVESAKVPVADEFSYSTTKIRTNFSNYSSWHYRSRLLPLIYPDPIGKRQIQEDKHEEELELVQNAAFTDPNDQSAWFYQRWLLGRTQQPLLIAGVLGSQTSFSVSLTRAVNLSGNNIEIQFEVKTAPIFGCWKSSNDQLYSHVWIFVPSSCDSICSVVVSLHNCGEVIQTLPLQQCGDEVWARGKSQFEAQFSEGITTVLQEQLESSLQLLDLEPDSKWTLLTTVLLMQAIDRCKYRDDTMKKLDQLVLVDPLRTGYYNDLRSRYEMEYAIETLEDGEDKDQLEHKFTLSGRSLTAFYHGYCLSMLRKIDLSHNHLQHSLPQLHTLQCCQELILDDNGIESLQGLPVLLSLHTLSLKNNLISTAADITNLTQCTKLSSLDMRDNPIQNDLSLKSITNILLFLKTLNGLSV